MSPARIVMIEDNPGDILLVELALEANGIPYEMTTFATGRDAVKVLCAPEGTPEDAFTPDAILLDLNTPKSDGFQVLIELRQCPRLAQVPIAIVTSSAANTDNDRAALQRVRYIQKPSDLEAFFATISQAVKEMLHDKPNF